MIEAIIKLRKAVKKFKIKTKPKSAKQVDKFKL